MDLAANATRAQNSATIAPPLANNANVYSLYTVQLNIAYVVDVFGGLRRQTESAAAQAENQKFLTEAVYLTLTVNVANAAIQLASLDTQMDDTQRVIDADQKTLDITQHEQRLGEASTADVAAAETALEQAAQLGPPLQKQIDQARDLLAVLAVAGTVAAQLVVVDSALIRTPFSCSSADSCAPFQKLGTCVANSFVGVAFLSLAG